MKLESKELSKARQLTQDCRDAAVVLQEAGLFSTGVGILRETSAFLSKLCEPAVRWDKLTFKERVAILAAYENGQPIEWVYNPAAGWSSEGRNSLGFGVPVWAPATAYRVMER